MIRFPQAKEQWMGTIASKLDRNGAVPKRKRRNNKMRSRQLSDSWRTLCFALALSAGILLAPNVWAAAVSFEWTATTGSGSPGSNFILAAPGDQVTLDILLTADASGVSSYGISMEFDNDLGNELNLLNATELLPGGFLFNLTPGVAGTVESDASTVGRVNTFEAATFGAGPVSTTFVIGQVRFLATASLVTDGSDIFAGLFNSGIDGLFNNSGQDLGPTADFGEAGVNLVPIPASLPLLGSGLAVLGFLIRRRR
jgi:hypothetical protein